jgi:hypothetical protein
VSRTNRNASGVIPLNSEIILGRLQRKAAPEFDFLLTEPPFRTSAGRDFGWYCREHAFCTQAVAALLGMACRVVNGDFIVSVRDHKRLSSLHENSGHSWCTAKATLVLDLSLHFREFGPGPQLAEPIVKLGRNGIFDIRVLPENTLVTAAFDTSVIGYIPRETCTWRAVDLAESPSLLLPTHEAAEISARVALHTFDVLSGAASSLIGRVDQADALFLYARLVRTHCRNSSSCSPHRRKVSE